MARIVRGGLIQASVGEDASAPLDHLKKRLVDKHVALIEEAARRDVQVACLQELFLSSPPTPSPTATSSGPSTASATNSPGTSASSTGRATSAIRAGRS